MLDIPNIFKNRTGAIQLSDLDANFDIIKNEVNTIEQQIATLQAGQASLTTQIANFSAIPIGCIIMWSGTIASIPSGWRLCDGTNNTPNLRDKFVIGASTDSSAKAQTTITGVATQTGGSKDSGVVSHTHSASTTGSTSSDTDSWSAGIRTERAELYANGGITQQAYDGTMLRGTANDYNSNINAVTLAHTYTHSHTITVNTTINSTGDSGTNANLPPYYALAFIMKV